MRISTVLSSTLALLVLSAPGLRAEDEGEGKGDEEKPKEIKIELTDADKAALEEE